MADDDDGDEQIRKMQCSTGPGPPSPICPMMQKYVISLQVHFNDCLEGFFTLLINFLYGKFCFKPNVNCDDVDDGCKEMLGIIMMMMMMLMMMLMIMMMFMMIMRMVARRCPGSQLETCSRCSLNRLTSGPWPPDRFARERNILLTF